MSSLDRIKWVWLFSEILVYIATANKKHYSSNDDDKYSLEHIAAHALGHLVYVHISCISRASYALWDSYHAL